MPNLFVLFHDNHSHKYNSFIQWKTKRDHAKKAIKASQELIAQVSGEC